MSRSKTVSLDAHAVSRALIENDLIEEFHWLPQDIANIPYKKLQEFLLIKREKDAARQARREVDSFKEENKKGSSKKSKPIRR